MTYSGSGGPAILVWGQPQPPADHSGENCSGREESRALSSLCISLSSHHQSLLPAECSTWFHAQWPQTLQPMDCDPPGSPSMGLSRQEYWREVPFPPPGDLAHPGIKPTCLTSPALAVGSLPLHHLGSPQNNTFSSSFYRGENYLCLFVVQSSLKATIIQESTDLRGMMNSNQKNINKTAPKHIRIEILKNCGKKRQF